MCSSDLAQIKRSGGKLYGLPLAAASFLVHPLLALGALTFYITNLIAFTIAFNLGTPREPMPGEREPISVMNYAILDSLAALAVMFFAGRAAWRKIAGVETKRDDKPVKSFAGSAGHLALCVVLSVVTLWFLLEFGLPVATMITGPDLQLIELGRQWHLGSTVDSIFSKVAALAVLLDRKSVV